MTVTAANVVLIAAGTLSGLFAGLLYAFTVAVVPGLRGSTASAHLQVMQAINKKIENPVFFLSFFGPIILLPVAAYLNRSQPQFSLLMIASAVHILGSNVVTVAGNIPLNNKLAAIDVSRLSDKEAEKVRQDFQGSGSSWMRLHAIRTWAAIASTVIVFWVCLAK